MDAPSRDPTIRRSSVIKRAPWESKYTPAGTWITSLLEAVLASALVSSMAARNVQPPVTAPQTLFPGATSPESAKLLTVKLAGWAGNAQAPRIRVANADFISVLAPLPNSAP